MVKFFKFWLHMDLDWSADLKRAGGSARALLREQSLWAIWVYRFGRRIDQRPNGLRKKWMLRWYWFLQRLVETLTGIGLPKSSRIGPGLRIWHFGGIFIHPEVVIGSNCTLRQAIIHALDETAEHNVTGLVAEIVVDPLEAVEIDEDAG